MSTTPRPLPRIPPPHLTFVQPAEVRSYRPLPTPPLWSPGSSSTSPVESVCLQTPPLHATRDSGSSLSSFTSVSSASSEPLPKPRPKLRIALTSQTPRTRNSLDSLTVRSPALFNPGQTLSPVVDRRPSSPKRAPHIPRRSNRVSVAQSIVSPPVFQDPAVITEPDIPESDEDELVSTPRILQPKHSTSDHVLIPRPPRSRPPPTLANRSRNYPLTTFGVVADAINDSANDNEIVGLNPRVASSIDLSNGHESRASNRKNWKPLPSISTVAMKSHLFCRKSRPTKSRNAPVTGAKRVSQMTSPLNQTWYKERDGWRWIERDVDEVLTELRKLR